MFGFNLPETHHLYYLATSFTDVWRRINIYWKDFVMKLFFYPMHFKLRRMGSLWALSLATLVTFLATWLLHSWQWFWIRGRPLFNWQDFFLLDDPRRACAGHRHLRGDSGSETNSQTLPGDSAATVDTGITSRGNLFFDVYSLGLLVMPSWAEFQALIDAASRPTVHEVMIVFGGAAIGLRLWHAVGLVESRNIRRARDTSKSGTISLLAFGGYSCIRCAMPFDPTLHCYAGYSQIQTCDSAPPW